jgi:hypothetical protein
MSSVTFQKSASKGVGVSPGSYYPLSHLGNLKKWKVFAIIRIYSIQKASEKGISLFQWGVALGSKISLGGVAKDSMRRPVD